MSLIGVQLASKHMFKTAAEVEDRAVTVRPSSTALFCVDSADRYASVVASRGGTVLQQTPITSPYQFTISKKESLLNGFFHRIALTEIVFPYYLPNINTRTDTIEYSHTLVPNGSITLGHAFYTPTELAAAVQAALIADGAVGTTVQYLDGKFYVDAGVGQTIAFFPTSVPPTLREGQYQLFDLMGFSRQNSTPSLSQTSRITRCRYTEYIDIVCSQLTYNQDLKDGSSDPVTRDILCRVYLECENDQPIGVKPLITTPAITTAAQDTVPGTYPFTIYRQFKSPKQIQWNDAQPIGNLVFEVYDDKGELFTTGQTAQAVSNEYPDWRMTLLISEN